MMRPFKSAEMLRPKKSTFDLSYSKLFDANMGYLYPIMCDEVVPGDSWHIGNEIVARVMPLMSPMLHEVNITVHYFFVPFRLLWEDWTDFISGGVTGQDASVLPRDPCTLDGVLGSLWDYLGYPLVDMSGLTDTKPLDFPRRAYSLIWDEYYRDETLQTALDTNYSNVLLKRNWTKDYFTSALPWAQRGISPALPISGLAPIDGSTTIDSGESIVHFDFSVLPQLSGGFLHSTGFKHQPSPLDVGIENSGDVTQANANWEGAAVIDGEDGVLTGDLTGNADLSGATTFTINDVRLAWQIQRWMERNARAGVRYTEFLRAHFGVSPRDDRLQRPEYIGGSKAPVIISEVLQTSQTTTGTGGSPQGNLAGHGISVAAQYCGKYFATEYGLIMGLLSIMPVPMYHQGINRQWLRRTRYDYFFPEFSTLGEQAVECNEIMSVDDDDASNKELFGFQGRYDEMRYKPNMVCGNLRPNEDFQHWTLCRDFADVPELNSSFIECNPDPRSWAVQIGAPQFVLHVGNRIKATRPLPIMGTPGLVDHH